MKLYRYQFPLVKMAQVLSVSVSGYYRWKSRVPSARFLERERLKEAIKKIFKKSHETYGSPRIYKSLQVQGFSCSKNSVAYIMRKEGLVAKAGRKYKATTNSNHPHPPAPNLLNQNFRVMKPDSVWSSDITYIRTVEGWLYLAVIIDLCTRKVVGWAMSNRINKELVLSAFHMAYNARMPLDGLIFHSDRGVQYACKEFKKLLNTRGIVQSMSGRGNCYDNAPAESFFKTLKTEEVYWRTYYTREEAKIYLFKYIEGFYNTTRLHSSLGYKSPQEFEMNYKMGRINDVA